MKLFLLVAIVSASSFSSAQASYETYRSEKTTPSFGLSEVQSKIAKAEARYKAHPSNDDTFTEGLSASEFNGLSVPERFTYCMIHGEQYAQNCEIMPVIPDSEHKIIGYLPDAFKDSFTWSQRQRDFLQKHRTEVIALLRKTFHSKTHVGVNLKQAIVEIDAYELIPDLIASQKGDPRDQDIFTVLMLLMKDGKYRPFLQSQTYKKLYKDEAASYRSFVLANSANQALTNRRATDYYKSRM